MYALKLLSYAIFVVIVVNIERSVICYVTEVDIENNVRFALTSINAITYTNYSANFHSRKFMNFKNIFNIGSEKHSKQL